MSPRGNYFLGKKFLPIFLMSPYLFPIGNDISVTMTLDMSSGRGIYKQLLLSCFPVSIAYDRCMWIKMKQI